MTVPVTQAAPVVEFPDKLVQVFEIEPKNYSGLIPALHDSKDFEKAINKWHQLGILYASDISRNAPPYHPIDYHMRVSENDT